jgi:hypothetical protein
MPLLRAWLATVAVIVHTIGHLLVAGLVAMIVYEKLGVRTCSARGSISISPGRSH